MLIRAMLLLLASPLVTACGQSNQPPGAAGATAGTAMGAGMAPGGQQAALTVALTQPSNDSSAQTLDTAGGIFAWQEVAIGAEVSGYRVREVLVDVGSTVAAGAVLARLDETLLHETFNQAQASVTVAKAALEQATANAQRGNTLRESGVISKQDAEVLNTTAATARAQLLSAESQLQAAKQRLDYAVIRAPDAGVISARNVVPGQIANTGSTLFSLIRQSRVEWRAEIPASAIVSIRNGLSAAVKRADGSLAKGTVRTVSPGIDANTQRGIAYIDLKLEPQIRPGMYVTGSINLGTSNALTVPLAAVSVRDGFSYVFVYQTNSTVKQQRIETGRLLKDRIEITSGLNIDQQVVSSAVGFLRDGDLVRLASNPADKGTAAITP
ncbi:MAG: efflux RND transporter periplasmic adaptor subunit [Steroidobacteraceae bacterium]